MRSLIPCCIGLDHGHVHVAHDDATVVTDATVQVFLDFGLSEQIYAKAKVKDVSSVGLWLGADVMLEYPVQEAKELLVRILSATLASFM